MDPLRSDTRSAEALGGPERDARIEQLLLAGLDEYFAQRYEHAINLWTRVLFLDRQHDRARAYIERARRAQAERQRESEAVLHEGVDAFHAGDVTRARQLVTAALDRGASPDEAHGMLERIDRLGRAEIATLESARLPKFQSARIATAPPANAASEFLDDAPPVTGRYSPGWSAAVLLIAAAIGVLVVGAWGVAVPEPAAWSIFSSPVETPVTAVPWTPDPLPLPQTSEAYLARARALRATGRLYDALAALDRVPVADPLRPEADRLRADVQRQLLSLVTLERPRE